MDSPSLQFSSSHERQSTAYSGYVPHWLEGGGHRRRVLPFDRVWLGRVPTKAAGEAENNLTTIFNSQMETLQ